MVTPSFIATNRRAFYLLYNKNFRTWLFLLLTCYIGLGPSLDLQKLEMIDRGLSYVDLGWIRSLSSPIKFLTSFCVAKFSNRYPVQMWYVALCLSQILFTAISAAIYFLPVLIMKGEFLEFWPMGLSLSLSHSYSRVFFMFVCVSLTISDVNSISEFMFTRFYNLL